MCEDSNIDVEEFKKIYILLVQKSFQCDLKFTNEMHITEIPSLVFFMRIQMKKVLKSLEIIPTMYTYNY